MSPRCLALAVLPWIILAAASRADESWETFTSKEGKFSISLPGKPTEQKQQAPSALGQLDVHLFSVEPAADRAYVVSYTDYPDGSVTKENRDRVLDATTRGVVKSLKGRLVSETRISIGKDESPGREVLIELPGKASFYRGRVYAVKDRLFQAVLMGPEDFVQGKKADEYFASFKLEGQ